MQVVAEHEVSSGASSTRLSVECSRQLVGYGGGDGGMCVFPCNDSVVISRLQGLSSPVTAAAFTKDQQMILGGSENGGIQAWDITSEQVVHSFEKFHNGAVTAMDTQKDGKYVLSASADNVLRIWDLRKGKCLQSYKQAEAALCCARFAPTGKFVATGCLKGVLRMYSLSTTKMEISIQFESGPISCLEFHPDFAYLIIGSSTGAVGVFDIKSLKMLFKKNFLDRPVDSVVCCGRNVVAMSDVKVGVLNLDKMQISEYPTPWKSPVVDTGYSSLTEKIYAVGTEHRRAWTGELLFEELTKGATKEDKGGDIVYQAVDNSPLGITEVMEDGEDIVSTLEARLAHVRAVRELWYKDQVGALQRIKKVTEAENDLSLVHDFLSVMQQQRMKEKLTLEALPFLLQVVRFTLNENVADELILLGLRTTRSMNTKFRARVEEGIRRARAAQTLRNCTSSVLVFVTRGDNVGHEARQLIQELPP
eukprot:gene6158-4437_t